MLKARDRACFSTELEHSSSQRMPLSLPLRSSRIFEGHGRGIKGNRSIRHNSRSHSSCASFGSSTSQATGAYLQPPGHAAYTDFQLLWQQYSQHLKIGRQPSDALLQLVRRGQVPCDVLLLRERVQQLMELRTQLPGLNVRQAINNQPDILAADSREVARCTRELATFLPQSPPLALLLACYSSAHLPADLMGLCYSELSLVVQALCGLPLPPALFRYLIWTQLHSSMVPCMADVRANMASSSNSSSRDTPPSVAMTATAASSSNVLFAATGAPGGFPATNTIAVTSSSPIEDAQNTSSLQRQLSAACGQLEAAWAAFEPLLGPELAYEGLSGHPPLLDCAPQEVQRTLTWLQQRLGPKELPGVLSGLPSAACGRLLAGPDWQVTATYDALLQQLKAWLRWGPQQVQELLVAQPAVLLADNSRLAVNWRAVKRVAARRRWQLELQQPPLSLVRAVLLAEPEAITRLLYVVQYPGLLRLDLQQVLTMPQMQFLRRCPGYLYWCMRVGPAEQLLQQLLPYGGPVVRAQWQMPGQQQGWVQLPEVAPLPAAGKGQGAMGSTGLLTDLGVRVMPLHHLL